MELQPSHCSCSHPFSVEHALNSKTGGFPAVRHNEVRDNHITASLLSEVCHGVTTEPICIHSQEKLCHIALQLQMMVLIWTLLCMVSGEEDLRRHFWMSGCSTLAPNQINVLLHLYIEGTSKKRQYQQRVHEVEHATFTPLVMSSTGSMGRAASTFFKEACIYDK